MDKNSGSPLGKVKNFEQFVNEGKKYSSLKELNAIVQSFDKGKSYSTLFGPNYRDTTNGTMDGDVSWASTDAELLRKVNREALNNKGTVTGYSEDDPNMYVLYVDLKKLGLKKG
jgi:V8-like Glu-specific endopeptidase